MHAANVVFIRPLVTTQNERHPPMHENTHIVSTGLHGTGVGMGTWGVEVESPLYLFRLVRMLYVCLYAMFVYAVCVCVCVCVCLCVCVCVLQVGRR